MGASDGIRALLLPASDFPAGPWALASSFYSMELIGGLMQGLRWVVRDLGTIARDGNLNVILPNRLLDPLDIELLEL